MTVNPNQVPHHSHDVDAPPTDLPEHNPEGVAHPEEPVGTEGIATTQEPESAARGQED